MKRVMNERYPLLVHRTRTGDLGIFISKQKEKRIEKCPVPGLRRPEPPAITESVVHMGGRIALGIWLVGH